MRHKRMGRVWSGALGARVLQGVSETEVPPTGSRGGAAVEGLGDEASRKLKTFYELMLLGWTQVKDLKHLRFIL